MIHPQRVLLSQEALSKDTPEVVAAINRFRCRFGDFFFLGLSYISYGMVGEGEAVLPL